ncbi:hypothetical protein ILFOPFJJ_00939 [Ensifer psoraleae]|nr:hypothetical protein [Sinorhizobium psoraleae]
MFLPVPYRMLPQTGADSGAKTCSNSKCYSDPVHLIKTPGAVVFCPGASYCADEASAVAAVGLPAADAVNCEKVCCSASHVW